MGRRSILAVTGITIAVAALFTLSTTAASAATRTASAPSHATAPSAAEAPSGCVTEEFSIVDENYYEPCVVDEQVLLTDIYRSCPGCLVEYALTADGYYGPLTQGDVYYFQSESGLEYDGITGPQTWQALCETAYNLGWHGTYWQNAGCPTDLG
jgi:peptidoglycan hydrolase-like protein with peptidoglycan-binding domain